jgi:hypothetical protein
MEKTAFPGCPSGFVANSHPLTVAGTAPDLNQLPFSPAIKQAPFA